MKKKTIFGTLVIVTALVVCCLPSIQAIDPDEPRSLTWVVTDDVEDRTVTKHNFYSEYIMGQGLESNHEQVWYTDDCDPHPISEDPYWVYTKVTCSAVSSGDSAILTVKTEALSGGPDIFQEEYVIWTIINGDVDRNYFEVMVSWYQWNNGCPPIYCEDSVRVYIDDETDSVIELDYCQALDLDLTYYDFFISPGQKEYWVVTKDVSAPANQWFTVQQQNPMNGRSSGVLDQVWYTDKHGPSVPIWTYEYHINTKCLVWAETVNTNDARIHVQTYGESNYYPEMINWTITGGAAWIDEYFNLDVDVNGTHKWDTNVYLDADPQLEIIGPIDNLDVEITYYGTDPDP